MEAIKNFCMGVALPYRLMFELFGGDTASNIFLWAYVALSVIASIAFIVTFPWLALALFAMGFAAPFVVSLNK